MDGRGFDFDFRPLIAMAIIGLLTSAAVVLAAVSFVAWWALHHVTLV